MSKASTYRFFLLHQRPLWYGFSQFFFSTMGQAFFLSLFVAHFMEKTGLSALQLNVLYTLASLSSAVLLVFVGPLMDRLDLRKFSWGAGIGGGLACLMMAHLSNGWMYYLGIFGLRFFGQGFLPLIGMTAMGKYFEADRGKALSFTMFGMSVAEMLVPALVLAILGMGQWANLWYGLGFFEALFFPLLCWLLVGKDDKFLNFKQNGSSKNGPAFIQTLVRRPVFWIYSLVFVLSPMLNAGFLLNSKQFLDYKNWSMEFFAFAFVFFGIGRIAGALVGGPLVDRLTARKLAVWVLLPSLTLFPLILIPEQWVLLVFLFSLGANLSFANVVGTSFWAEVFGPENVGTCRSLTSTMMVLVTAVAPTIFAVGYQYGIAFFLAGFGLFLPVISILAGIFGSRGNSSTVNLMTKD
ncbi:MFS transporter [Persicobacter diffluens]